jgi:hypothetical protein
MGVSGEVDIYFLISGDEYVAPATLAVAGVAADDAYLLRNGGLGQIAAHRGPRIVREVGDPRVVQRV